MFRGGVATEKTALGGYVSGWRHRARSRQLADARLRRARWHRLRLVAQELLRSFGVTRVTVFGSMARGEARADSDVDLLVEGLEPERLIEATVVANRLMVDAPVDLVPLKLARPEVLARACAEGVVVHV